MNLKKPAKKWYKDLRLYIVSVAAVLAMGMMLPWKIAYTIEVVGKVMPAREWFLVQSAGGRLAATLFDHRTGMPYAYTIVQFERGDAVSLTISPGLQPGAHVAAGDTVGVIYSFDADQEILQLRTDLAAAEARLNYYAAGRKTAVVEQARSRLAFAQEKAAEQEKILHRVRELYQSSLISKQELEISESQKTLSDIGVSIAEAALRKAITGVQAERIEIVLAQIRGIQNRLDLLERKIGTFFLKSPLQGTVYSVQAGDTLLTVGESSRTVVLMPIKLPYYQYLAENQRVRLIGTGDERRYEAKLVRLDAQVRRLNGEQVILAAAVFNNPTLALLRGAYIRCEIYCDAVPPLEYLRRLAYALVQG